MNGQLQIDRTTRHCKAGAPPNYNGLCGKSFTMADYPLGYFTYKGQLQKGSVVNTCPKCEVGILRKGINAAIEDWSRKPQEAKDQIIRFQQDIFLLLTGRLANTRQRLALERTTRNNSRRRPAAPSRR